MRFFEMDRSSQFDFRRLENQLVMVQSNHLKLEKLSTGLKNIEESARNVQSGCSREGEVIEKLSRISQTDR